MGYLQGEKPITISKLLTMHRAGEKISVLTAYDSTMSALLNANRAPLLSPLSRWLITLAAFPVLMIMLS